MAKRVGQKIKMTSIDELLCVPSVAGCDEIEVAKIRPFKDYPFKVLDDEKMHELVEKVGESRGQLHWYLRLVELIPPILELVDKKDLALVTAVEVSFLDQEIQQMLYEYMCENEICKTFQIFALRDYLKENDTITKMELMRILNENAPKDESNRFQQLTITKKKLQEYFPVFYTKSQMEKVLYQLLEEWKKQNNKSEG
ncbi:MAG: hypothetical protein K6G87_10885 [Butyrivibrio sp.]|uniref:hypothetical protein n=1 Tax=Butyrivibrio sp. TaxID=28121 RepID=UPI0025E3BE1B|nr:hypothetical protein [Butyrivibrio sp.]MCR5771716.1 hypothetical protein [Butyrivibrio sp.]